MILKIALLQLNAEPNNEKENVDKAQYYCRKASALGADIILLPEMWNIGYTPHHEEVWDIEYDPLKPKHPELLAEWKNKGITTDSNYILHFRNLAKELEVSICITYLRNNATGDPYNSASLINKEGNIVLTYDKVHTCDFSGEHHCSSGSEFKTIKLDTDKGEVNIGIMICYDREFPESARILMLKGAEIILVPNACGLEINRLSQLRSRSYENMVGVALCNYAGSEYGNSIAFDGMGFDKTGSRDMTIIKANEEEQIVFSDFDLEKLREYRKREVWGNAFRKPKSYGKLIDEKVDIPFLRKLAKR